MKLTLFFLRMSDRLLIGHSKFIRNSNAKLAIFQNKFTVFYSPFYSNLTSPISARPLSSFFSVSFAINVNLVINSNKFQVMSLTSVFLISEIVTWIK